MSDIASFYILWAKKHVNQNESNRISKDSFAQDKIKM